VSEYVEYFEARIEGTAAASFNVQITNPRFAQSTTMPDFQELYKDTDFGAKIPIGILSLSFMKELLAGLTGDGAMTGEASYGASLNAQSYYQGVYDKATPEKENKWTFNKGASWKVIPPGGASTEFTATNFEAQLHLKPTFYTRVSGTSFPFSYVRATLKTEASPLTRKDGRGGDRDQVPYEMLPHTSHTPK
jgi:hypothetical protein